MENSKQIICRLCCCNVEGTNYDVMDNIAKNVLTVIFPNLQIKEDQTVMCSMCSVKVLAAVEFKTLCLGTEGTLESYIKSGDTLPLDLNAIYQNEKDKQLDYSNGRNICRLCMQLEKNKCTPFGDAVSEMVQIYIPEVNLCVTKDPVICKQCLESVVTYANFIKSCLDMEKEIKTESDEYIEENIHCSSGLQSELDGVEIKQCPDFESTIKIECKDEIVDSSETYELEIKQNCVIVKSEEESAGPEDETHNTEGNEDGETPYETKSEVLHQLFEPEHRSHAEIVRENYNFQHRKNSTNNTTNAKRKLEGYKADHTSRIVDLVKRKVTQAGTSKLTLFKCEDCSFETKHSSNFHRHKLQHADPSTIEMFKCDQCPHETRYRDSFRTHKLMHADPSDIVMFHCGECPYRTKYKSHLKTHQLKHADASQLEKHKCDTCPFETVHKSYLKQHRLKHMDPSAVEMFKCEHCPYQTRYKGDLRNHKLTHADPSQFEMHECDVCSYRSIHKKRLTEHKRMHLDPSEIKMFRCSSCPYQAKSKSTFRRHKMKHADQI